MKQQRYPNWEHVRIEHEVPSENCTYEVQEACSAEPGHCFNWYKQRATLFSANTVVVTSSKDTAKSQSRLAVFGGGGGGNSSAHVVTTMLADYYYCP